MWVYIWGIHCGAMERQWLHAVWCSRFFQADSQGGKFWGTFSFRQITKGEFKGVNSMHNLIIKSFIFKYFCNKMEFCQCVSASLSFHFCHLLSFYVYQSSDSNAVDSLLCYNVNFYVMNRDISVYFILPGPASQGPWTPFILCVVNKL